MTATSLDMNNNVLSHTFRLQLLSPPQCGEVYKNWLLVSPLDSQV